MMSYGAANPLDFLFKLSTQRKLTAPVFSQVIEQGPPHMKTFVWRCTFMNLTAEGQGRSKKEAKTAAARAIKERINSDVLPPPAPPAVCSDRKRKNQDPSTSAASASATNAANKKKKKFDYGSGWKRMNFGSTTSHFGPVPPPHPLMSRPFGSEDNNDAFSPPPLQPSVSPPMYHRMSGGGGYGMNRMTVDDHYVITKHKQIFPKDQELKVILQLVNHTEEALRKTSDALAIKGVTPANEEASASSSSSKEAKEKQEAEKEEQREVMGVARVGELAKGLLLSSDRAVNVVVMCRNKPTTDLLRDIQAEMEVQLKIVAPEAGYQIHVFEEEGGFCVVSVPAGEGELPYAVNVTLTSTKVRDPANDVEETKDNEEEAKEKEEEEKTAVEDIDPENMLPRKKCIQALAELRRSNWFANMAVGLPSCVECIRIIKEMSNRDPSWNCLSDWAIELLVERALFSARRLPLNPAASLLRVLEVIASGLFLEGGPGLKDPCEREPVDAAGNLTPQQREDITHSAQQFIRQICYRQIHKVLGMEKLPPREKRNRRDWRNHKKDDEETETKQVQQEADNGNENNGSTNSSSKDATTTTTTTTTAAAATATAVSDSAAAAANTSASTTTESSSS